MAATLKIQIHKQILKVKGFGERVKYCASLTGYPQTTFEEVKQLYFKKSINKCLIVFSNPAFFPWVNLYN